MNEPKTIPHSIYLQALGLFTIGNDHYTKGREIEDMANGLLGLEDGSHVSDVMFDKNATVRDFDEALRKAKVTVEDPHS